MRSSDDLKGLITTLNSKHTDNVSQTDVVKCLTEDVQVLEQQNRYLLEEMEKAKRMSDENATKVKKLETRLNTLKGYFKECLESCPSEDETNQRRLQTLLSLCSLELEETWNIGEYALKPNYDFLRSSGGDDRHRISESQRNSGGMRVNLELPLSSMLRELNSNMDTSGLDRSSSGTTSTLYNTKPRLERLTKLTSGMKRKCEKFLKTFEDVENRDKLLEIRRAEAERVVRSNVTELREERKVGEMRPPVTGMRLNLEAVAKRRNSHIKIEEDRPENSDRGPISTTRRLNIKDILGPYSSKVIRGTRQLTQDVDLVFNPERFRSGD